MIYVHFKDDPFISRIITKTKDVRNEAEILPTGRLADDNRSINLIIVLRESNNIYTSYGLVLHLTLY